MAPALQHRKRAVQVRGAPRQHGGAEGGEGDRANRVRAGGLGLKKALRGGVRQERRQAGYGLRILDFRFWILDCSIIGSLCLLSPARSAESSGRSALQSSD